LLKAILIDIVPPGTSPEESANRLAEAENLVKTYGGIILVKKIQKKSIPNYDTFVGKGKIQEIIDENAGECAAPPHEDDKQMQADDPSQKTTPRNKIPTSQKANILIVNNEMKPRQTYNLGELLRKSDIAVWDRVDLILKIFQKHATTHEAKLEIELASLKHMGPRIFGMGMQLSRQGGGIGTKGVGETNIEFMRRHLFKMETRITKQLEEIKKRRKLHRESRRRNNFKTVSIIGYTNAGKSTLLNALTRKGAYTADKLFATLDTRVGRLYIPPKQIEENTDSSATNQNGHEILVSDTIGFIQDLPTTLIKSFRSTLEETIESDHLLHVIDISDPRYEEKIKVVNEILAQIDSLHKPTIYVFNKMDMNPPDLKNLIKKLTKKYAEHTPAFISSISMEGINNLKEQISRTLFE